MYFRKRAVCLLLSVLFVFAAVSAAAVSAEDVSRKWDGKLHFRADGSFKILMIGDLHDDEFMSERNRRFVIESVRREKPDLICVMGDLLPNVFWFTPSARKIEQNARNFRALMESLGVPYAVTLGNHDHDWCDLFGCTERFLSILTGSPLHVDTSDGCGPATYSVPICASGSDEVKYVLYIMDTNTANNTLLNDFTGIYPRQLAWYNAKAREYKAANGGEYVPSSVIQHIPVAEIYEFTREVPLSEYIDPDTVYHPNRNKWYKLNTKAFPDLTGVMCEAPLPEVVRTGEFDAWKKTGVVSAFFAHNHHDNFGATLDGIYMAFIGGTGFGASGNGDQRSCRVLSLHENDRTRVDTRLLFYRDVVGEKIPFVLVDILSPVTLTKAMKVLYFVPSVMSKLLFGAIPFFDSPDTAAFDEIAAEFAAALER